MSKKNNDNLNSPANNNIPASDSFSFLELNQYLTQSNINKENKENKEKKTKKKTFEKKEPEKKQKLKIEPNANIAREQTNDDLMYIEKEDNLEKEEKEKKAVEKEEKKEEKVELNIKKEKSLPKKIEEKKKFNDKRIVTINLEQVEGKKLNKDPDKKDTDNENQNDGFDIEEIINDIKEKDPQAYTPIVLPFEKSDDEGKSLKDNFIEKDDNDQNRLFMFQFPRQIPIKDLEIQEKTKEEENFNNQPNYDEKGNLISPEFKNSFQEIKDKTVIGKLVFMKSGKVKIKMGDTYFDINQGSKTKFAQYSAIVNVKEDNKAYILGQPFYRKLIVTPEID
jgi:hypothetical protein